MPLTLRHRQAGDDAFGVDEGFISNMKLVKVWVLVGGSRPALAHPLGDSRFKAAENCTRTY